MEASTTQAFPISLRAAADPAIARPGLRLPMALTVRARRGIPSPRGRPDKAFPATESVTFRMYRCLPRRERTTLLIPSVRKTGIAWFPMATWPLELLEGRRHLRLRWRAYWR